MERQAFRGVTGVPRCTRAATVVVAALVVASSACGSERGRQEGNTPVTRPADQPPEMSPELSQTPLIEPPLPEMASARVLASGRAYDVEGNGQGTIRIYRLGDGSRVMRLEDFFVSIGSGLEIRLSAVEIPRSTDEVLAAPFKSVGPLRATAGSMNYRLPRDIDLGSFRSVVIWSDAARTAVAAASLKPGAG